MSSGRELSREPLAARVNRVRNEYADQKILMENIDFHIFREMAGRRELPPDAEYVALLGTIYSRSRAAQTPAKSVKRGGGAANEQEFEPPTISPEELSASPHLKQIIEEQDVRREAERAQEVVT